MTIYELNNFLFCSAKVTILTMVKQNNKKQREGQMYKKILLLFFLIFFAVRSYAQVEDRFSFLNSVEVGKFTKPLATTIGTALNSGSYYTASIPSLFGFSISFKGMIVLIPDDQKTFTPSLPSGYKADANTATIYGSKSGGGIYGGANGYITYPGGIDESSIPIIFPQISASLLGSELMIRYMPDVKVGDRKVNLFGFGLKHNVSQYFILLPVDIAVQLLYNKFKITDLMDVKNYAINAHASKTLGVFTAYGGLQYEKTKFNLDYQIKGDPLSGDPELRTTKSISTSIDGDNNVRMTLGAAVKLGFFVLNADYSLGSQSTFTGGFAFVF